MDRAREGGAERQTEKGISLSRDGEREMNARKKALSKRSVGRGGDLRQRIKVGLKCRND